ncbi:MAG: hypothetical protein AB8B71_08485 [Paracoccaceae bacterium]
MSLKVRLALLMQSNFNQLGAKPEIKKLHWTLLAEQVSKPEKTPHISQLLVSCSCLARRFGISSFGGGVMVRAGLSPRILASTLLSLMGLILVTLITLCGIFAPCIAPCPTQWWMC